ncbi:MAG: hypothetical protein R3344_03155 [Acidobacteriota bacterium]|nr:hypothetical protein [Acidobacteriota bacterium]
MRTCPVLNAALLLVLFVGPACVEAADNDYKITMTMTDPAGNERVAETYIVGGRALEVVDGRLNSVMDLGEATWTDVKSKRTVPLVECIAWVDEITRNNIERMNKAADSHNKWIRQRMLEPEFEVEQVDELLVLSSQYFVYRISPAPDVSAEQAKLYYEYDRLNANCGAMVRGELPPNVTLAILEELQPRGIVPASMDFEQEFDNEITSLTITYDYGALTSEERAQVAEWLTE